VRLANNGEVISRFRILELLSEALFGLTCREVAKNTGKERWSTRSFRASLATRLRRLRSLGLVHRKLDRLFRPVRSRRVGIYRWYISERGRKRLLWAKSKKLV
jgi:hypothetical protein